MKLLVQHVRKSEAFGNMAASNDGDWHSVGLDELRSRLQTDFDTGLRRDQIAALRAKWGPNTTASNEPIAEKVLCLRDGTVAPIDAADLLPADIRILSASGLKVNNVSLTYENHDVELGPEAKHAAMFQAKNVAYCSCKFTSGAGRGVVFATGDNTYSGRIAKATTTRPATCCC